MNDNVPIEKKKQHTNMGNQALKHKVKTQSDSKRVMTMIFIFIAAILGAISGFVLGRETIVIWSGHLRGIQRVKALGGLLGGVLGCILGIKWAVGGSSMFSSDSCSSRRVEQHYTDYYSAETSRNTLLIIDPQKDFHPGGSLAIPTANKDAARIANLIANHAEEIDDIVVTLDTHQKMHIAHPLFWRDTSGAHPKPLTHISSEAVERGEWVTTDERWQTWGESYVSQLEANKRFELIIWPEHCLIGTDGHAVVDNIMGSLMEWAAQRARAVEFVLKGHNMLTEHYSAFKADVVRRDDPRTAYNEVLLQRLLRASRVIICGQALSHCVAWSTRDLLSRWPVGEEARLVLLTDCCSAVPGFEKDAESFVEEMRKAGVTVTTSTELPWTGTRIEPKTIAGTSFDTLNPYRRSAVVGASYP